MRKTAVTFEAVRALGREFQDLNESTMYGSPALKLGKRLACVDTPVVFLTCPVSLGVGAALMLTKGKNHWLYVNYKQDGVPKKLALKLDKSEYEQVLKTAHDQTGKDVEILVSQKRKSPAKK